MSLGLWALVGVFVLLALLRVPIALAMFSGGIAYLWVSGQDVGLVVDQTMNTLQGLSILLAVPMFILAANVMNAATISERLWAAAEALVGRFRGGLAHVTVLVSVVFSGMSGSAVTDAAGPGMLALRMMRDVSKYPAGFSAAIIAASATIAPIIPPSILFVLLGAIQNLSIGQLFLAGILPGVLMFVAMFVLTYVISRKRGYPREQRVTRGELWQATLGALLPLAAPLIVLRAIMVGLATPTEAAAILVVYVAFLGLVVYRTLNLKSVIDCAAKAAAATAVIMLMAGVASMFARIALQEQFGQILTDAMLAISSDVNVLLLLFNIILLVLGMFMDALPIMLVLAPITFPIFVSMGVDPIALGVVMVINLTLGLLTPPVGLILSTMAVIGKIDIISIFRAAWPYFLTLCGVLAVCTYVPQVILFLPRMMMPN